MSQIEGAVGCWHIIPNVEFPIVIGTSDVVYNEYRTAAGGGSAASRSTDYVDGAPVSLRTKNAPLAPRPHPPVACNLQAPPARTPAAGNGDGDTGAGECMTKINTHKSIVAMLIICFFLSCIQIHQRTKRPHALDDDVCR